MIATTAETYRTLFETAPDATLLVDARGHIVLANAQAERLFGRSRGELVGALVESLLPQRLREAHQGHRHAYAQDATVRAMGAGPQLTALRGDGTEFPVEVALGPVDGGGDRLFVATVRDVSDLARTREAARRGRYNLFAARFGLRALQEAQVATLAGAAAPLVAEAMRTDAVVVFVLPPAGREFQVAAGHGLDEATLAGLGVPQDPSSFPGCVVASRDPVAVPDFHGETRFSIPAALTEAGLASALCAPLFRAGEVFGVLAAARRRAGGWDEDDVHFMQSIANALSAAHQRAATEERLLHAQRLEALGQLTGGVAHDFNNLLMVISGSLQMIQDIAGDRTDAVELSRQAMGAADRGAALTRKLLAFARKQPLNPVALDLNHLVTGFRDLVQRTLGEQVAVVLDLDPSLPNVVADAAQVETALLNLAVNARDAMPEGGLLTLATARVRVTGSAPGVAELGEGEYARVSVADTGTGMPPEVLARAIEPFFTTKEVGKGSGLGLSMVYGFARQSGGTVALRSTPGEGSCVELYLPLPPEEAGLEPGTGPLASPAGSETILVVEDDPAVRGIAVAFLEKLGYRVLAAGDARDAMRLLGEHEVELLFTDVSLPGMDGVALVTAARAVKPGLPVLYASAYLSGPAIERLPRRERTGVLAKPYRREELAFRVRMALGQRERRGG